MLMRAELGLIFPVNLRKVLIFTDFPTGSGSKICTLLKICEYQGHPSGNWKFHSSLAHPNIKYNCVFFRQIYWLFIYASKFSHRSPLYEFFTVCTELAEMAILYSKDLTTAKKSYLQWGSTWCKRLLLI